jgi:hypothetical protein
MAVMKKKSKMDDPWAKPARPSKKITTVPKKVVEAKPKRNPNAPKPAAPKTGNVKVVEPKKTKPKGSSNKGGKGIRGGIVGRGGRVSGFGGGMNWANK